MLCTHLTLSSCRFRLAAEERQWRDIAFCLSLLPYKSERSIKKLIDALPFYQDKLHNPEVYRRFTEILAKARSNRTPGAAKKDSEAELAEFEAMLGRYRDQGEEDEALGGAAQTQISKARATRAPAAKKPAAAKKTAAKKPKTRRRIADSDEDDDDEGDDGDFYV